MVDDIEMARPKGLLILFTSFKLLDILPDAEFRHVVNAMRPMWKPGANRKALSLSNRWRLNLRGKRLTGILRRTDVLLLHTEKQAERAAGQRKPTETKRFLTITKRNQLVFLRNQTKPIAP